ncbi:MAG: aminomethyl transferase family protein [Acidobacteriota bacterium]|nr:aminomethyl transferase family protein [Acidobacteriota bacterium]
MSGQSLAAAMQQAGGALEFLRNAQARPHTFPVRAEFSNWRSEQTSWRQSCALLDQSHHMTDLFLKGPDALPLLTRLGVNSFVNFAPGKAKQYVAVNADGFVIGDAILFHLPDGSFDLVGHPMVLDWVEFHALTEGADLELERDENSIVRTAGPPKQYRFELQGPTAAAIVEGVTGRELPDVKFFNMASFEVAGLRVDALRHGMAGQPGFELFGPWEQGERVREALLAAGEQHGLVQVGSRAYSTANLESGWVPAPFAAIFSGAQTQAYREWLPAARAGSLAGSFHSEQVTDYYLTPYELGYGKVIAFDHEFVGGEALAALQGAGAREKVTLVWHPDDLMRTIGSALGRADPAKFIELPKARYGLYQADSVRLGDEQVGISQDCGYIYNERAFVSLASIDTTRAPIGSEVTVLWGESPNSRKPAVEPHVQVPIRATVAPAPYVSFARDAYRSA